jgi:hypothetical protein
MVGGSNELSLMISRIFLEAFVQDLRQRCEIWSRVQRILPKRGIGRGYTGLAVPRPNGKSPL